MTNRYVLALDGGATKTTMTIRTSAGRELFSATSTSSNYQTVGIEHVQHVFTGLLRSAAAHLSKLHIDVAVFAVSGVDTKQDKKIIEEIIEESAARSAFTFGQILLENDAEATVKGLGENNVSLLISGTGALCYSVIDHNTCRTGGWGHRIGDEGSGYWIGKHIAKAIFRAADGRNEKTALTELVLQGHKVTSTDELYNFIYSSDYTNARLAELGSYLQQAVDQKDAVAQKIAERAAKELVLLVTTALKNAGYQNEAHTLFLNGGVLKNNRCLRDVIIDSLNKTHPNLTIHLCEEKPLEAIFKRGVNELQHIQLN